MNYKGQIMVKKQEDYINQFCESRDIISQFAIITKEIKKSKMNKPYLELTLQDKTGQIKGRMFTNNCRKKYEKIKINSIYNIIGLIQEYPENSNHYNIKINEIRQAKKFNEEDFRIQASNYEEHISFFFKRLQQIENNDMRKLLSSIFTDENIKDKYLNAPAAKIHHHNYRGGLLVHTNEIIALCDKIADIYEDINRDLLITGAILHDIGKIETYDLDDNFSISINKKGQLIDHLYIGANFIEEKCKLLNIDENVTMNIIHMILSHHGNKELGWGSTIDPKTPEAIALHQADDLSAKMNKILRN